ncbi:MAG: transcription antitermination factor NusB [Minisyncoccia bacterium]
MANRHLARSIVLQTAFESDFRGFSKDVSLLSLKRNIIEFGGGADDLSFATTLLFGILGKKSDLDNIICKAAPDWPIDKISIVDRNILRMGLYELLFSDRKEVPAKVAINESIEIAKTFSGDKSGGFVNGVLGTIYKELGEPGKNETTKKDNKDRPYEQMPIKILVGAVVYGKKDNDIYLAFVHDVFGRWTLSKGRLEKDESLKDGLLREIKEELGLDVIIEDELQSNEYIANHPEEGKIRKQVKYFLANSNMQDLKLGSSGGLDDAKWFKLSEIQSLNFYNDILPIITKAISILGSRPVVEIK